MSDPRTELRLKLRAALSRVEARATLALRHNDAEQYARLLDELIEAKTLVEELREGAS